MQILQLDIRDPMIAEEIWRLQHKAYAVEAQLIRFQAIPPLLDTVATLQSCEETFYGIRIEDELAAAISCEITDHAVTICRMMVHPEHFRKGYAKLLLAEFERRNETADSFIVSTASANYPAVRLYEATGFSATKVWEPLPGLQLTQFKKVVST